MQPVVGIMFERCSVGRWIYPLANGQPLALYNKMEGMVGCATMAWEVKQTVLHCPKSIF